jgi:hypothetical protein
MAAKGHINPNAGGNTSSSRKGYQHMKGGGQGAHDVKTLNATEAFADPNNLMCDEPYLGDESDRQFGYNYDILGNPGNSEDTQGTSGWKMAHPGPGITRPRKVSGSKDPTPGGGW